MANNFGWSYPPGVNGAMIDEAFGAKERAHEHDVEGWEYDATCDCRLCAAFETMAEKYKTSEAFRAVLLEKSKFLQSILDNTEVDILEEEGKDDINPTQLKSFDVPMDEEV